MDTLDLNLQCIALVRHNVMSLYATEFVLLLFQDNYLTPLASTLESLLKSFWEGKYSPIVAYTFEALLFGAMWKVCKNLSIK